MSTNRYRPLWPAARSALALAATLVVSIAVFGARPSPGVAECEGCNCQGSILANHGTVSLDGTFCVNTVTINTWGVLDVTGELIICAYCGLRCAGTLNINADSTVYICGGGFHNIGGTINLLDRGATLVIGGASSCLTNNGELNSQSETAGIVIARDITLTNAITIRGHGQIRGDGNFTNQHAVNADVNGTLTVAVAGRLNDSGTAEWKATAAGAVLNFDSTIGTLDGLGGDFIISGDETAEISVNHTLTTTGRLCMTDGILDVNEDLTMGSTTNHMHMTGGCIIVAGDRTFVHY